MAEINDLTNNSSIQELFEKAESFRIGTNGIIDKVRSLALLKSAELKNCDIAIVTARIMEEEKLSYITESLFEAIRDFVLIKLRSQKFNNKSVLYNITVEIDDKTNDYEIAEGIYNVVYSLLPQEPNAKIIKEQEFYNYAVDNKFTADTDIIFVTGISNNVFEKIPNLKEFFFKTPNITKILFINKNIHEKLKNEYSSFYYQAIGHTESNHASAINMQDTDIYPLFIKKITEDHSVTQSFCIGIKQYIEVVYHNADLQKEEFINDLLRRVESQMLTADFLQEDEKGIIVTEEGIPYSKKVEIINSEKSQQNIIDKKDEHTNNALTNKDSAEIIRSVDVESVVIPHEIELKNKMGKPAKNILLLNLSTFPYSKVLRKNEFKFGEKRYSGIYQLDPIPKMLSEKLAENGEYLDEIIMLATSDTLKQVKITVPLNPDSEENVNIICSPEEYFICQVKNYLKPLSEDFVGKDPRFHRIEIINVREPSKEISEAVGFIRKEFEDNNNNVKLFIDAHGSLRGLTLATLAINSLLLSEGKGAEEVYSIEMQSNEIFADPADKLFNFVSGINEFKSFGRIDSLEKYMGENAKELTNPMKEVSSAISACNVARFEEGIKKLRKYFNKKPENKTDADSENYLSIFSNTIKEDYGSLLNLHSSVIDEIEWCLNKKLYQAALTIVESRVSKYYFGEISEDDNYIPAKLPIFTVKEEHRQEWESDIKYGKESKHTFSEWLTNRIYYRNENNVKLTPQTLTEGSFNIIEKFSGTVNFDVTTCITITDFYSNKSLEIQKLTFLLKALKQTRNTINHCKKNIPDTNIIHSALQQFIELAKKVEMEEFVVTQIIDSDNFGKCKILGEIVIGNRKARLSKKSIERVYNNIKVGDKVNIKIIQYDNNNECYICELIEKEI